jgi:uncharacterized DUF497 family protein
MKFKWDFQKAIPTDADLATNLEKYGVSIEEASKVFGDPLASKIAAIGNDRKLKNFINR